MSGPRSHGRVLVTAGVLTAAVLALTVSSQLYNSNLLMLGEATALLAGDHPYRDFFEIGMPLAAYLSAGAQWLSGHRLIAEYARQWVFIVAGVVIAFRLGLRLSRSAAAMFAVLPLTLAVLAGTPTYHYSKLFFFPLLIWLAWRYVERPGARGGALLGAATAAAFLYRHDYGIYAGLATVLALLLARAAVPSSRRLGSLVTDATAGAVVLIVLLTPWAVAVQASEGLIDYTQSRAALNEPPAENPFRSLLAIDPRRSLLPGPQPPAKPAIVRFIWQDAVADSTRLELERGIGLRLLDGRDAQGRLRYAVDNAYDTRLLDLDPYINDGEGFEWNRLRELGSNLPTHDSLALWLMQMALVVPIALGLRAAWLIFEGWRTGTTVAMDAWRLIVAAAVLAAVDAALFRETGYVVVVAPLTAALAGSWLANGWMVTRVITAVLIAATTYAAVIWAKDPLMRPTVSVLAEAYTELLSTPDAEVNPYRYLHECTRPGDRLLLTGQTPAFVSHHAQRPFAGGHSYWHTGWRSDPAHEAESLAMIERSPIPIAFSTHDPVLVDFARYPRIRQYLETHYRELEGTAGTVLIDTRRQPTGTFGPKAYPCFG
jgi:hypothetical protein